MAIFSQSKSLSFTLLGVGMRFHSHPPDEEKKRDSALLHPETENDCDK